MEKVIETLTTKKNDSWGSNLNDFKEEKELTVEITLNEYRELIKSKALKENDIKEANKDKYKREEEIEQLKSNTRKLEEKLFEYRKKYGDLEAKKEGVSKEIEEEN